MMPDVLILKLHGVMQAWGGHTFEDFRPSHLFPTRSGLLGLLGACLGIERKNRQSMEDLSASFVYAVRSDTLTSKMIDFHTVMDARKVDGKMNPNPVVSTREYLCNARFTAALIFTPSAPYSLEQVKNAVQQPVYTPFLGRRSCPLTRPLYEKVINAETLSDALAQTEPYSGTVYSEQKDSGKPMIIRDVPTRAGKRQFSTRAIYIIQTGGDHVSE